MNNSLRNVIVWITVFAAATVPVFFAVNSELLQWRDPVYIVAGFAGVIAMVLLLFQPLLASGYLPGANRARSRRLHRLVGTVLLVTIIIHVAGLWITSPPDVVDALLFRSATSFSMWGVIAMCGVFLTALLAALRNRFRSRPQLWRIAHKVLAVIIVTASVVHAVLIDGTMETISKYVLCLLVSGSAIIAITTTRTPKVNSLN